MLKHNFAGHTIDPDSLLRDGVLCFDHRAAGQKAVLVNHLHIVHVHELSGDRTVIVVTEYSLSLKKPK